jgi:predicted signal transduction protein with EAL and GGDEF domain
MREHGCDIAQGYLYARPASPEDLTPWLQANQRIPETYIRSIAINTHDDETGT